MCCSKNEIFSCKRINSYYNVISEFDLRIPDQNSDITIINEINNATLFFMNKKFGDNIYIGVDFGSCLDYCFNVSFDAKIPPC